MAQRNGAGISTIECMLTLPVLFLVVAGFIDFMRYVAAHNALEISAREALTLATYIPNLEQPELQQGQGPFEAARSLIADRARLVTHNPLWSEDSSTRARLLPQTDAQIVTVPPIMPGATSRDPSFIQSPIEINLQAQLPLISLPIGFNLPIRVYVAGYRERRAQASNPVPLDCSGEPLIPGLTPAICDCGQGAQVDPISGQCACIACQAPRIRIPGTCSCGCPPETVEFEGACCPPGGLLGSPTSCAQDGLAFNPRTCQCETCAPGEVFDPARRTCVCPQVLNPSLCGQTSSGIQLIPTSNPCGCRCPGNLRVIGQSPGSEGLDLPECGCADHLVLNPQGNYCVCPPTTCPGDQTPDPQSCSCGCPAGKTWDPHLNQCACPESCPSGMVQGSNCDCSCTGGRILLQPLDSLGPDQRGRCGCPPGTVETPSGCGCDMPEFPPVGAIHNPETCEYFCPPDLDCPVYDPIDGSFDGCDCSE